MGRHPSDATLSRYVDGDLNREEKTRLKEHLKGCSECKRRLAEIIHIKDLAQSLEPVAVPTVLLADIRGRIAASEARKTPGLWRGIALGFAVSAATLLFTLLPHSTSPGPHEGPVTPAVGVTPLVIEPAVEPLGPPLGLAHAQDFGSDQPSETASSELQLVVYEEPCEDSTSSRVILIPLDEKARQDMAASRRQSPPFRPAPRSNGEQGFIVTVGETLYR